MIDVTNNCNSPLGLAQHRAMSNRAMAEIRREELASRLRDVAFNESASDGGPRYVLAQNVGASAEKPLWLFFSVACEGALRLVFSGSGVPVEFSEAEAVELSPLLGSFAGEVVFTAQQRAERRAMRKSESEQTAREAIALGLLSNGHLHASGEACAKAVEHSSHVFAESFVINHVTQDRAGLVNSIQLPAVAGGLVVDGKSETKRLADGVERVAHGVDSVR